jgi:hypothetical protein
MAALNQALLPPLHCGVLRTPKHATGTEDEAPPHTRCTLVVKCNGIKYNYFSWLSSAVAKWSGCNGKRNGHLGGTVAVQKRPFATAFATAQTHLNLTILAGRKIR